MNEDKRERLDLFKILKWVGGIGAIITSLAYIIFLVIIVLGMETKVMSNQMILISGAGALAGFGITIMLRSQGILLAKDEEESKRIEKEYNIARNKSLNTKKLRTIGWHVTLHTIRDLFTKVLTLAAGTYFSISIFMEGNGDFALIGLGIMNILMFFSFGIIAMNKAYNYYKENHLRALEERTIRLLEEKESSPGIVPVKKGEQYESKINTEADLHSRQQEVQEPTSMG